MTVDMTEMASMIKAMGGGDEDVKESLGEMDKEFADVIDRLESVSGVINVRKEIDSENFVFSILFDFNNVEALNKGLSEYYNDREKSPIAEQFIFFNKKGDTFERTNVNKILEGFEEEMQSDESGMDMSSMFGDLYYETIVEFDTKIKSVSNKDYEMSNDKKTLKWRKYLFKDEDSNKKVDTRISLQ